MPPPVWKLGRYCQVMRSLPYASVSILTTGVHAPEPHNLTSSGSGSGVVETGFSPQAASTAMQARAARPRAIRRLMEMRLPARTRRHDTSDSSIEGPGDTHRDPRVRRDVKKSLGHTAPQQLIPCGVDVGLNLREQPGVLGREEMLKAALRLEELLDRLAVVHLHRLPEHVVLHLVQRPEAGLNSELGDLHRLIRLVAPAAR